MPFWLSVLMYILFFIVLAVIWKVRFTFKLSKIKAPILIIISIVVGVLAQAWHFIASALAGKEAIRYAVLASHDQAWHAALIKELIQHFPPQIPGYSESILKNYHYFYDLLISGNVRIFGGDVFIYIQFIYPILISFFFGVAVYRICSLILKRQYLISLAIIFAYLGNSLAYILSLYGVGQWQSDTLLLDQPIIYLFNQQTVLSLSLMLYLFYLFNKFLKRDFNLILGIVTALMLVSLFGIKAYGFVLVFITMFIVLIKNIIKKWQNKQITSRNFFNITIICIFLGINLAALYLLNMSSNSSFIKFAPGWILDEFFLRLILPIDKELASHKAIAVLLKQNWKILMIQFWTLILFIIGNFHIRILGILAKSKSEIGFMFKIISIISLFIVIFFNQSSSPYNIIQFGPYAMIATSILLFIFLDNIKNLSQMIIAVILIFAISLPISFKAVAAYSPYQVPSINQDLLLSLEQLEKADYGTVLVLADNLLIEKTNPVNQPLRTANIIGAVSGQPTYLIDLTQLEVLQIDYLDRESFVNSYKNKLCNLSEEEKLIFKKLNIRYILVGNTQKCLEFDSVYDTPDYRIYKID